MRGGRSLALETLHLPRPIAQIRKTAPETVAAHDQLLNTHTDEAAARELNRLGHRNWKGEPNTAKRLRNTRRVYGLPSFREREKKRLRDEGLELTRLCGALHSRINPRSTSRNNNAPPFEEIDPPKKFHRTWRLRQFENENVSSLHSVTVWLLVRSSPSN